MEISTDQATLYQRLAELGWEVKGPPSTKTVDGNIVYSIKVAGPAGQIVERQARTALGALASALHYAQRSNMIRGAALLPTEIQIPGVIGGKGKPFRIGERDVNSDYQSGYADDAKDAARQSAPEGQRFPSNLFDHVQETAKAIDTGWYLSNDPTVWENAVMNAFRVALLSPRKDFSWNAIHYQDIADMPHESTANDYFHRLEKRRRAWNYVTRGDEYGHARYKRVLDNVSKRVKELNPEMSDQDAQGVAFDVLGQVLRTSETAYIAARRRDPRAFDAKTEKWKQPPTSLEVYSKALDLVNDQLAPSLEPDAAERLTYTGLKQIPNLDDFIHEAMSGYTPGSRNTALSEKDIAQARNASKHRPEAGYGAFVYGHLQAIQNVSAHIKELAKAAHDDVVNHDGGGHSFRNKALSLGIKGMNAKVVSFAWLLLSPRTSQLGTMDTHMTRFLTGSEATNTFLPGIDDAAAGKPLTYYAFERMLKAVRDDLGYSNLPLGQFQWVIWDLVRQGDDPTDVGSEHRAISIDPNQWKPVADVKWPDTATRKSDPRWHPPEWMRPAMAARVKALYDYMTTHGGNAISDHPDPDHPKPLPQFDYLNLGARPGKQGLTPTVPMEGFQQHPEIQPLPQPVDPWEVVAAREPLGIYEDELWDEWNNANEPNHGGPARDWEVYEGEDDELHHTPAGLLEPMRKRRPSEGDEYGREAFVKNMKRSSLATAINFAETIEEKKFTKDALRGYDDAERENRESKIFASGRTYEAQERVGIKYLSSYDLIHIASALGNNYDLEGYDAAVEDITTNYRLAATHNEFDLAATFMRSIQKFTGDSETAMVAGLMFLEDNGHEHAMEEVDDVRLAYMVSNMREADVTERDVARSLESELQVEEKVPNFRFVFYKGVLNVQDYHHNLGFQELLAEILKDHNKDLTDDNVQDDEIASGDISTRGGELDIELKSLADNDVQHNAINAIHEWAEGINLIGDIRHISSWEVTAATPEEVIDLIASTDLQEGSKWDRANPGDRKRILNALQVAASDNPNSRVFFRYLTSYLKKTLPRWSQENDKIYTTNRAVDSVQQLADMVPKLKANNIRFDVNQHASPSAALEEARNKVEEMEAASRLKNDPWDSDPIHSTSNGYQIYPIKTEDDLEREGKLMGHCIGEGAYHDRLNYDDFYSVRDKNGAPHATMQVDSEGNLKRFFGKSDVEPKPEYKDAMKEFANQKGNLNYDGYQWGNVRSDGEEDDGENGVAHPNPDDPYIDNNYEEEFHSPPEPDDPDELQKWMKSHDYGRLLPPDVFNEEQDPWYDEDIGHVVALPLDKASDHWNDGIRDEYLEQLDTHPVMGIDETHPDWQHWVHHLGDVGHLNYLQTRHENWSGPYKNQHLDFLKPHPEDTPQQQQLLQQAWNRAKQLQHHVEEGQYNYRAPNQQPQLPAPGGDPWGRGGTDWEVYNEDRAPGTVPGAGIFNR